MSVNPDELICLFFPQCNAINFCKTKQKRKRKQKVFGSSKLLLFYQNYIFSDLFSKIGFKCSIYFHFFFQTFENKPFESAVAFIEPLNLGNFRPFSTRSRYCNIAPSPFVLPLAMLTRPREVRLQRITTDIQSGITTSIPFCPSMPLTLATRIL